MGCVDIECVCINQDTVACVYYAIYAKSICAVLFSSQMTNLIQEYFWLGFVLFF